MTDVTGGSGGDTIVGDGARNRLDGQTGDDVVRGGGGDDDLSTQGAGQLDGGDGFDFLYPGRLLGDVAGGTGEDYLGERFWWPFAGHVLTLDDQANDGPIWNADTALDPDARLEWPGNVHSDVEDVDGSNRPDLVVGSSAPNYLRGLADDDTIAGGAGEDTLDGGSDEDALWARDGSADTIFCGGGADVAVVDGLDTAYDCERVLTGNALPDSPNPETVSLPPYQAKPAGADSGQAPSSGGFPPPLSPFPGGPPPSAPSPGGRPPRGGTAETAAVDPSTVALDAVLRRVKGKREWVISGRARGADVVVMQGDAKPFDRRYRKVKATPATRSGFFRFTGLRPRRPTRYRVMIGKVPTKTVTVRGL